jgi:hypothetical protein
VWRQPRQQQLLHGGVLHHDLHHAVELIYHLFTAAVAAAAAAAAVGAVAAAAVGCKSTWQGNTSDGHSMLILWLPRICVCRRSIADNLLALNMSGRTGAAFRAMTACWAQGSSTNQLQAATGTTCIKLDKEVKHNSTQFNSSPVLLLKHALCQTAPGLRQLCIACQAAVAPAGAAAAVGPQSRARGVASLAKRHADLLSSWETK